MTIDHDQSPGPRLDAYMDGQLSDTDASRFEADLQRDPILRSETKLQCAIEESLGRIVDLPSAERFRVIAAAAAREVEGSRWRLRPPRALAIAASLLMCISGVWMIWNAMQPGVEGVGAFKPMPRRTMAVAYHETVDAGFRPQVICRDATEFENWFVDQFGRGLRLLDELPEDVSVLGLGYGHTISESTIHLLVEVDSEPVMVFVDVQETAPPLPPVEDLNVFRHEVAGLVLFELSPLETARVIPFAMAPAEGGRSRP